MTIGAFAASALTRDTSLSGLYVLMSRSIRCISAITASMALFAARPSSDHSSTTMRVPMMPSLVRSNHSARASPAHAHDTSSNHRNSGFSMDHFRVNRRVSRLRKRCVTTLDPCIPRVTTILPKSAFAAVEALERLDEFDPHDVCRHLVAELPFDARADRRAVADRQVRAVDRIRQARLRVQRIDDVDAFVIRLRAIVLLRIGAMKYDITGRGQGLRARQHLVQRHAGPLRNCAPPLDAVVAGDLRPARHGLEVGERIPARLRDETVDLQPPVDETVCRQRVIRGALWPGSTVAAEWAADVGLGELLRERVAADDQALRDPGQRFARF